MGWVDLSATFMDTYILCFAISDYLDEAALIPKNTSVLVRRVPGRPRMNIVTEPDEPRVVDNKLEHDQPEKSNIPFGDSSAMKFPEESEWDEFGNDLYAIPEILPVQSSHPVQDAPPTNRADEDSKIKALIDTPALDWQRQTQEGFSSGRGFGRGMGGRMMGGRGFGRAGVLERKTPPAGYICHRCKVPGHFIQHCPTNGDPNYDIKRVKPPTGIPKSMLMATPDGSYALPSGAVAVLKPNEAAFEREIEGLPSTTRSVGELPPELRCPLCKEVMKDAVLTSKCCFTSFCDRCIRDHIISKSICVCGATNVLADDLLPNKTLRDTINRILESNNSSTENAGSMLQIQDMESARCAPPKAPSPTFSANSKGENMLPPHKDETPVLNENEGKIVVIAPEHSLEKGRSAKTADISEATHDLTSLKEQTSQGSAPLAEEEVQQKLSELGKKKKKKKVRLPTNEMQWRAPQDFAPENYMMPLAPSACNPYWGGMQFGMDGYVAPYGGAFPYMGYTPSPFDIPFGGMLPQDPFAGQYMMPVVPPQRDLSSEFGMGSNPPPPAMSREEFEARKADLRRKREMERRERERSNDREFGREMSGSGDVSSMKSKSKPISQAAANPDHRPHHRTERPLSPEQRPSRDSETFRVVGKRKSSDHHHHQRHPEDYDDGHHHRRGEAVPATETAAAAADRKQKASVFSRISFPEDGGSKKRKVVSSSSTENNSSTTKNGYKEYEYEPPASSTHQKPSSNGYDWKPPVKGSMGSSGGGRKTAIDYDSSDDERHFKRKPSRYEPPSPSISPPGDWEEDGRPSRGSREKDRGRDHEHREYERERERERGYSKHR